MKRDGSFRVSALSMSALSVSVLCAVALGVSVAEAQETANAAPASPAPAASLDVAASPETATPSETASSASPSPAEAPAAAAAATAVPEATAAPAPETQAVDPTPTASEPKGKQEESKPKVAPEPPEPPGLGTYQRHVEIGVGLRNNWFADEGYSQFDGDAYMPQISLTAGYAFWNSGNWSLAGHGTWDYGSVSSNLRGLTTGLQLHRMTLGASLRYHLARPFFVFARVAPGARYTATSLKESATTFSGTQWAFVTDLTVGAQMQLLVETRNDSHAPRWWIGVEGGYGLGTKTDLTLNPSEGAPSRTDPIILDPLELSGGLVRLSTSLTF